MKDIELKVVVTITVSPHEEDSPGISKKEIVTSVNEGVWEALNHANKRGFNHPLSNQIVLCVTSVEET